MKVAPKKSVGQTWRLPSQTLRFNVSTLQHYLEYLIVYESCAEQITGGATFDFWSNVALPHTVQVKHLAVFPKGKLSASIDLVKLGACSPFTLCTQRFIYLENILSGGQSVEAQTLTGSKFALQLKQPHSQYLVIFSELAPFFTERSKSQTLTKSKVAL